MRINIKSIGYAIFSLILIFALIFLSVKIFPSFNNNFNLNLTRIEKTKHYAKKEKIGILVIALGKYNIFWKDLYKSSEKYFLPDYEKHYFIFTDDLTIPYSKNENVHLIYHKKMGWPFDSMMRYEMFLKHKDELAKFDYLYFFNINFLFKKKIGEEVLPTKQRDNLVVTQHWLFYDKPPIKFSYERNPNSTAYIPIHYGKHYYPGGFIGGTSEAFLELSETCDKNIKIDLKKGIIAIWHDESHINRYLLHKNPLILPLNYMWPEEVKMKDKKFKQRDIKIILRDKNKYGGRHWLRGATNIKNTPYNRLKYEFLINITKDKQKKKEYKRIRNNMTY